VQTLLWWSNPNPQQTWSMSVISYTVSCFCCRHLLTKHCWLMSERLQSQQQKDVDWERWEMDWLNVQMWVMMKSEWWVSSVAAVSEGLVVSLPVCVSVCLVGSVEPANYYCSMLEMVRNYLDGNIETTVYEEQLREMFGIYAYVGFTMDKLVQNIVRQVSCCCYCCHFHWVTLRKL